MPAEIKCCGIGCGIGCGAGAKAEYIVMGLSLCWLCLDIVHSHPKADDFAQLTPGQVYQWLSDVGAVMSENPRAISVDEQRRRITEMVGYRHRGIVPMLMAQVMELREKDLNNAR